MNLKYISLIILPVQNALFAISLRYSRVRGGDMYLASTVVLNTEIAKFLVSLILLYLDEGCCLQSTKQVIKSKIFAQPFDTLKVCVPSFVYVIQNNLLYFSACHLDAATFQITFQLKILTTAVFSVILLQRKLLGTQWLSLLSLLIGVILVELADVKENFSKPEANNNSNINENRIIGIVTVIAAALCSGFAGIYFEKILKGSTSVSLWIRNIQLSFCSIPIGLVTVILSDWNVVHEKGFFCGYDALVIYLIILQSAGGILVGIVVKFADNLLKGFAAAFAIVLACTASIILFNFQLTTQFIIGTAIIIASTFIYSYKPSTLNNNNYDELKRE